MPINVLCVAEEHGELLCKALAVASASPTVTNAEATVMAHIAKDIFDQRTLREAVAYQRRVIDNLTKQVEEWKRRAEKSE